MALRNVHMSKDEDFITSHKDAMYQTRTALPGIVDSININSEGALDTINVKLAINAFVTDSNNYSISQQEYPVIPNVPIVMPRSNVAGLSITVPIKQGDSVLLIFADRSIDNWQSSGEVSPPAEQIMPRLHDITDAIAIIGLASDAHPISNYNNNAVEIRNSSGSVHISLSDNGINIAGNVNLEGDLTVSGTLTAGGIDMNTHHHTGNGSGRPTSGPEN